MIKIEYFPRGMWKSWVTMGADLKAKQAVDEGEEEYRHLLAFAENSEQRGT